MTIEQAPAREASSPADATAAGDSLAVAAWTLISRVTGFVKVAAIGAVLGATFFGNAYQFTNSLPNLVYYGFLAGSLFSSLLVPALVGHIDARDNAATERVAGGFLGITLVALACATPIAVGVGPSLLTLAGGGGGSAAAQEHIARVLILMFLPQLFLYGVVGTASASMNARQRFALAAAAPAAENLGTVAVLVACGLIFGTNTPVDGVGSAELLLLGFGSTGAVALHAALQWWGARRCGVRLVPRAGWRDAEVRLVVRRAIPSLAQAGLLAVQTLTLLTVANRVAGGVVAFQIALNFYFLAIALGATPVALSLLPRLSRMHQEGDAAAFRSTLAHGYRLGLFIGIPTSIAYLVLAVPAARAMSVGRLAAAGGPQLVAAALAALAVAIIGQTLFIISTYASYARKDTKSPLVATSLQAGVCLVTAGTALLAHGPAVMTVLGVALSGAVLTSGVSLATWLRRKLGPSGVRITPSVLKALAGALLMIGPAWLVANRLSRSIAAPAGTRVALVAAAVVGVAIFVVVEVALRSPELSLLTESVRGPRSRPATPAEGRHRRGKSSPRHAAQPPAPRPIPVRSAAAPRPSTAEGASHG